MHDPGLRQRVLFEKRLHVSPVQVFQIAATRQPLPPCTDGVVLESAQSFAVRRRSVICAVAADDPMSKHKELSLLTNERSIANS